MKMLGVRIDEIDKQDALEKVDGFVTSEGQYMIFTPNPEMLVDAQKDVYFKEVLNESDLNICDGRGIELFSKGRLHRIPGTDFMQDLLAMAEQKKYSVYFLGSGKQKTLDKLVCSVKKYYPDIKIAGVHPGNNIAIKQENNRNILDYDQRSNDELLADIAMAAPDILFVAFGHNKQEKWIYENLKDMPSVKVATGVGGAFDYFAGNIKRAPRWMRAIGFEWLFRLVMQPSRIMRISKAVLFFPLLYIYTLIKPASVNQDHP